MAAARKQLYNRSTLQRLSEEPNSCVSLVESERKLELHPIYLNDIKSGVWDLLNKSLKRFDRSLNGILMGYKNIRVVVDDNTGRIKGRCGEFEVLVKLQFYIFQPRVGSYLEGVVNKKSKNHIGCLVHRYFNAVILKPELVEYEDWTCKDFDINDKIVFKVHELDFSAMLPRIVGEVESDYVMKKDNRKKKKKHSKEETSDGNQSGEMLDESFLQIEKVDTQSQVEKKEDVKTKKVKKHKKRDLELPCNSTQRFSATEKELQDADFSFLSPVVPTIPAKKKKEKKRCSDEVDTIYTSTQIPVEKQTHSVNDLNMLSPIERIDDSLSTKKHKKKKKEKDVEKREAGETNVPTTSTQIPSKSSKELATDDFYIFTPDSDSSKEKKKKKDKTKAKEALDEVDKLIPSKEEKSFDPLEAMELELNKFKKASLNEKAEKPVNSKDRESNDSSALSSDQGIKRKKEKKKKKDKNRDRDEDKSEKTKPISKSNGKSVENKNLETNLVEKLDEKHKKEERSFDPLEAMELELNKYKKLSLNEKADKSDSDEDSFIPATQIPLDEKSSNLPQILSRSSYGKPDSDENSQKSSKDVGRLKNKFDLVHLKSPLKVKPPKKRGPSDSDSESISVAKKLKLDEKDLKDSFKYKLELVNHKSSPKKAEPAKTELPKKLFSPEKSLFSDSDASVKKSPKKKIPPVQNLLVNDLLTEQKLTMLGSDARDDKKKNELPVPVKSTSTKKDKSLLTSKSDAKNDKLKRKRSKSETKTPATNKLLDDILNEAKKSVLSEGKPKKEKNKSTKKDVVNGAIDKRLLDLKRESSEPTTSDASVKEKKKKTSHKKEKEVKKSPKAGAPDFNTMTKSNELEIQKLLSMALQQINYKGSSSKKKKNISI